MKHNPKYHVFSFRATDKEAERIRKAAAQFPGVSAFLQEAATEKATAELAKRSRRKS